ncbi:16S rRNA (cytosine(967)-C(5))-methyltransferase RsmB [Hydrogenophaga intermedia]|uniref:16S rRNA (cytosine(967)-C(5))-methyltransferase RsmB n=1 Tax=Hydrogenophaga intermedia TaxID=65786 RepID=UPI0020436C37|nr:16S rRNA (cytosine(967)-C(5))-methyltransferase RsmB [Hydrogenophaga intermedia]MCM3563711.1 16S rRNA (cytosine(967)-C(5))-methyltransferase RsmB [Hydrogenophaga intermedia]
MSATGHGMEASRVSTAHAPALAAQLAHVARAVLAVRQGRSLGDALAAVPAPLRAGVQALAFQALRQLGTTEALVARLADRAPPPPLRALMCAALALLVAPDTPGASYPAHTVVDQAVRVARDDPRWQRQAGFLNACLRRYLREAETLHAQIAQDPVAQWNHPRWWIDRLRREQPEHWQAILRANNRPGPMTLRVNRRRATREAVAAALAQQGVDSRAVGDDGLELARALPVEQLPGFADGWCSVQDEAAQLAAPLLLQAGFDGVRPRLLDACAAPGGKTAHLLERADADLLALDVDAQRCERVSDNLQRLGLHAEVRCADAAHPDTWWDGRLFDAILLDAPCTASGIVRRHPDVRWLRRDSDVAALAQTQRTLLDALWPLLRPGGRLVYATCSVFRAEGSEQAQAFLQRHTDARPAPAPGHLFPGLPDTEGEFNDNRSGGPDGFFYACFDKARPR